LIVTPKNNINVQEDNQHKMIIVSEQSRDRMNKDQRRHDSLNNYNLYAAKNIMTSRR
jgi:hypothetical protein